MKKYRIGLLYILILIGFNNCNLNKKDKPINTNETLKNEKIIEKQNIEKKWSEFENEVLESIEKIKKSNKNNRKELLEIFTTYAMEVDGVVAEGYFGFAYDYPNNNTYDFFSILEKKDTILLDNWALSASEEFMLILENINYPKEYEKKMIKDMREKYEKLNTKEQEIADLYLKRLIKYSKPNNE